MMDVEGLREAIANAIDALGGGIAAGPSKPIGDPPPDDDDDEEDDEEEEGEDPA